MMLNIKLLNPRALLIQVCLIISFTLSPAVLSQNNGITKDGDYDIHHSLFNSSFLKPEIASAYGFVRGKDKALLNIAITKTKKTGNSLGLPAVVTGEAKNLMQQRTSLAFKAIVEEGTVYYLAPFSFNDQELLHFKIDVHIKGHSGAKTLRFTTKLYEDL